MEQRCASTYPAWNGYQEDIKAIGAGVIAQWQGRPTRAAVEAGEVLVEFQLGEPWRDWKAAVPVLIRTPEGQVIRNRDMNDVGAPRVYRFTLPSENAQSMPPWIEIHFPHTRQRVHLNAEGTWTEEALPYHE